MLTINILKKLRNYFLSALIISFFFLIYRVISAVFLKEIDSTTLSTIFSHPSKESFKQLLAIRYYSTNDIVRVGFLWAFMLDYLAKESGAKSILQKQGSESCLHILDLKDIHSHQKES